MWLWETRSWRRLARIRRKRVEHKPQDDQIITIKSRYKDLPDGIEETDCAFGRENKNSQVDAMGNEEYNRMDVLSITEAETSMYVLPSPSRAKAEVTSLLNFPALPQSSLLNFHLEHAMADPYHPLQHQHLGCIILNRDDGVIMESEVARVSSTRVYALAMRPLSFHM